MGMTGLREPGFVLVPADRAPGAPAGADAVRGVWQVLDDIAEALVVSSSSAHEDTEESSTGRFRPVPDVRGWEAFQDAVRAVLDSARHAQSLRPSDGTPPDDGAAVLVQPTVRAAAGGVLSTADPVTGHTDRILVTVASGEWRARTPDRRQRTGRALPADPLRPAGADRTARTGRAAAAGPPADHPARVTGEEGRAGLRRAAGHGVRLRRRRETWLLEARPIIAATPRPTCGIQGAGPDRTAAAVPGDGPARSPH